MNTRTERRTVEGAKVLAKRGMNAGWAMTVVLAVFAWGYGAAGAGGRVAPGAVQSGSVLVHAYGAFWKVGPGYETALMLRNEDAQNAAGVKVVLYTAAGQAEASQQVTVVAGGSLRVDLRDVLGVIDSTAVHWGGLSLETAGQVRGQLLIQDSKGHNSFRLKVQGGYRYDTENALHIPWWLSDQNEAVLTTFNSSEQRIEVRATLASGGGTESAAGSFSLGPHESRKVNLGELVGQSGQESSPTGVITLRYSGPGHALQPALFISSPRSGFSLTPTVNGRHQEVVAGAKVVWHFPEVMLSAQRQVGAESEAGVTAYALLSNATSGVLTPEVEVAFGGLKKQARQARGVARAKGLSKAAVQGSSGRAQRVSVPVTPLQPLETRLVNLSELMSSGVIPAGVSQVALTARHGGMAGDLGITVFSVESGSQLVFRAAGMLQAPDAVDATLWSTGKRMALPVIRNESGSAVQVQTTLYYQSAQGVDAYLLPGMEVPGRRSRAIGLRQTVLTHGADAKGSRIPAGVTAGIATLSIVNDGINKGGAAAASGAATVPVGESSAECYQTCDLPVATMPAGVAGTQSPAVAAGASQPATVPPVHFAAADCPPLVTGIAPSTGVAGQTVNVTISGEDLNDSDVNVAGGIEATVNSVSPDGTSMSATFQIPFSPSAVGAQEVVVGNLFGDADPVTFTVTTPPAPSIESPLFPSSGQAGTTVSMIIDAVGRSFHDGDSISVTGGIAASISNVDSDGAQLQGSFQIPICSSGAQQVVISDPFGQSSAPATFTVTDPAAPVIGTINPPTWQAGAGPFQVTISGTGMNCSPVVSSSDANITFGTATFLNPDDPSTITVQATVDPSDPGGAVDVFITTGGGLGGAAFKSLSPAAASHGATSPASSKIAGSSSAPKPGTPSVTASTAPTPFITSPPSLVTVVPENPAPQIFMDAQDAPNLGCQGGSNITGKTKSVSPGQRLFLCVPAPSGFTIQSQQWTVNNNDLTKVVNGYAPSGTSGKATLLDPNATDPQADMKHHTLLFYAIVPQTTILVQYTYTLKDASGNARQPVSASTTFTVGGPKGITMTIPTNPVQLAHHNDQNNLDLGLFLSFGNPLVAGQSGITFNAKATSNPSSGQYQWIQLISRVQTSNRKAEGTHTCESTDNNGNVVTDNPPNPTPPVLDSRYPYTTDGQLTGIVASTSDNPGFQLTPGVYYEVAELSFKARMYLLWDPALKSTGGTCTPASIVNNVPQASTCDSIPVPLGSVAWSWQGDTVNQKTSNAGTVDDSWLTPTGSGTAGTFVPAATNTDYPQWSGFIGGVFTGNVTGQQCTP